MDSDDEATCCYYVIKIQAGYVAFRLAIWQVSFGRTPVGNWLRYFGNQNLKGRYSQYTIETHVFVKLSM